MPMIILTSSEDIRRARPALRRGPVFIADRGRPAYLVLTTEMYRRLAAGTMTLAEMLAQEESDDFDFDPPRGGGRHFKPADPQHQ